MKKFISILSILFLFSSFVFAQNTRNFIDFDQLGIQKESFIEQFGKPAYKDMAYDQDKNTVETLYYIEDLKQQNIIIIRAFTFKNNELIELKSRIETSMIKAIFDEKFDKIYKCLTEIERHTRFL